ncbi:phosphoenolpyruvate synthase [Nostocales cyanobacterium HT-58-2]|nr:phosphoenolpyruvate synthase [Nostocales cyanobacterium HT-58-2]
MDKLYWLDQIKLQDRAKVGDKAFFLSRMMQRGYPVVPGFVVSAEVLREFLETLSSSEALVADLPHSSLHIDVNNWRQLQQVAGRLRQEIRTAHLPPDLLSQIVNAAKQLKSAYLIFRPTLVMPTTRQGVGKTSGLLESQICRCDEDAITSALKRTWSQMFRAKSLLYWQWAGINLQKINLGVLIQPLKNAIASGSVNANSSEWEILSSWGLGVAMTQGEVLPDVYYINPETCTVTEKQLGNKMLAYSLDDEVPVGALQTVSATAIVLEDDSCLVTYLLEEDLQKQYALSEEDLQQLIQVATQLVKEIGVNFTFEWTISCENATRTLHLTQVSTPQSAISHPHFIKGLAAAAGRVTATTHVILNSHPKPEQLPQGVILVAPTIAPDWLPLIQKSAGIITEQGGLTSHAAILARELAIPAVVSVPDATTIIQSGETLLIDGNKGEVYRVTRENRETTEVGRWDDTEMERKFAPFPDLSISSSQPASSRLNPPMIATQLLVNLSQPSLIEQVQSLPVDGVGLLRSELMALNILEGQHPNSWIQQGQRTQLLERWREQIMQFARAFAPRPVFYRSLDWRSHELSSFSHSLQSSTQSMLGERGTFSYLKKPAVFELELAALAAVQKAGYSNIHLLLPFVRTVEEFSFCRQKVEQARLTQIPQFQLWIMAEVPSVLFLLPEYVKAGVAGISIGTNDLTQLLLGVDREQGQLATVYNERHPVIMGAIAQLIQSARSAGISCCICGQAPVLYPEIIDQLVQWGITSISVEPEAVERTYLAIARAEQRILLEAARRQLNQQ